MTHAINNVAPHAEPLCTVRFSSAGTGRLNDPTSFGDSRDIGTMNAGLRVVGEYWASELTAYLAGHATRSSPDRAKEVSPRPTVVGERAFVPWRKGLSRAHPGLGHARLGDTALGGRQQLRVHDTTAGVAVD
jgi:hypothetical protein